MTDPNAGSGNAENPAPPPPEPASVRAAYAPHRTPDTGPRAEITPETAAILDAIRDALDVPLAAHTADDHTAERLLRTRTTRVIGVLDVVAPGWDAAAAARAIRRQADAAPVTYTAYQRDTAGGES